MNEQDILVIRDISTNGFSSRVSPRTFNRLEIGDVFSSRMRYLGELYDLQARVSWKNSNEVGFELENPSNKVTAFLHRMIQPIALAHSLKRVDTEYTKGDQNGKVWYHGDDDTDLYIWHDENQNIFAWQLISSENYIDWDQSLGLHTGYLSIVEHPDDDTSGQFNLTKKSLKQNRDATPNSDFKQMTIDILMATDIPERDHILANLIGA